ncbi:hypothetical protein [Kitasatospora sp. McL0602]|uniref:hypothetical protein n=1 Tax=Kitasatospora sp. McL0602 TaxID=3439530 RepID=UPI003F89DC91
MTTTRIGDQKFPCKFNPDDDFAKLSMDAEGDIILTVEESGEHSTSVYLDPHVAEAMASALDARAEESRSVQEDIRRARADEAEEAARLAELDQRQRAGEARKAGKPSLVPGGKTDPAETPKVPTFADTMLPQPGTETRERAFLRATEILPDSAGFDAQLALAHYLLEEAK